MSPNWTGQQPIGLDLLEENAAARYSLRVSDSLLRTDGIRCCVRGCQHWLARRRRGPADPNSFCPDHGISVSTSPTYVYRDYRQNFIVDIPKLERVQQLKVESWRLGNERSEDAVSWNVFVGLAGIGGLRAVLQKLTGLESDVEPELYLWGVRISDAQPRVWSKLEEVRRELEKGAGWPTEPDAILRVPGRAIVLIEAKFGSPNGTMLGNEDRFGAVTEFLDRYPCLPGKLDPLNRAWIEQQTPAQVLQQLLRNVIFAQWLADTGEVPFVVNLVRGSEEVDVGERFAAHLTLDSPVMFHRRTWEELFTLPLLFQADAQPLKHYLGNKTIGLRKAFSN